MIDKTIRQIFREEFNSAFESLELKFSNQDSNIRWLTTKKAAEYLGVSTATIYNWVNNGKLERHYIENSPRYDRNEIDEILKNS